MLRVLSLIALRIFSKITLNGLMEFLSKIRA
jgi:hypothetical protein